jgi:hypothetical protein
MRRRVIEFLAELQIGIWFVLPQSEALGTRLMTRQ